MDKLRGKTYFMAILDEAAVEPSAHTVEDTGEFVWEYPINADTVPINYQFCRSIEWVKSPEEYPCALEAFFKANPDEKFALLYCGCPKCSVLC